MKQAGTEAARRAEPDEAVHGGALKSLCKAQSAYGQGKGRGKTAGRGQTGRIYTQTG